ncbi:hypothetical protein [Mesorhizobium sp.]|uniref:hypothetical protein n=1 Tax=Mesorhizobium sp. TaxID=1871066 RepID=UPI00120BCA01|nr:hypothetical protein [Mesorhizobium sp.]TIL34624.1 MAG: hypothetical protein E5Y85_09725 [Mesorhizobium sp.]TIM48623.1 MAG: hypothetical protein E5Y56_06735 [Mesorhizobium sp.]
MSDKVLGILELETRPVEHPGFMAGPGTFPFPVKRRTVPGAFTRNVIDGDKSVEAGYVAAALDLERQGISALVSNCGFTGLYQAAVADAVSIPVAMSSLLLVPFVARTLTTGAKIGILTYDAPKLTEKHFSCAGWSSSEISVAVGGIEGGELWHEFAKPTPDIDLAVLIWDVREAAKKLLKANPDIGAFVFECTAFPIAAGAVRRDTGFSVADVTTLANMLFGMSADRCIS